MQVTDERISYSQAAFQPIKPKTSATEARKTAKAKQKAETERIAKHRANVEDQITPKAETAQATQATQATQKFHGDHTKGKNVDMKA